MENDVIDSGADSRALCSRAGAELTERIVADLNLDSEEFERIVKDIGSRPMEMQQIAIEASKILTATQERIKNYENCGFFKRFGLWLSGGVRKMERQNQSDLIKAQKLAWYFLMKLQEQNLLQASAIAVIRNNLRDVAKGLVETQEMIGVLVEKLDVRIGTLETSVEQLKWLVYLDGRRDRFVDPVEFPVVCALQLVYDYMRMLRDKGLLGKSCNLDIEGAVRVALSKFGIDRFGLDNKVYTVEDFIMNLFDQEQKLKNGRETICDTIKLTTVDGEPIKNDEWKTICGIGFNALYDYDGGMQHYKKIRFETEEQKRQLLLPTIRDNINAPENKYSLVEFASEIIGGCQLVIESASKASPSYSPFEVLDAEANAEEEDGAAQNPVTAFSQLSHVAGLPGRLKEGATFHINADKVVAALGSEFPRRFLPDGVSVRQCENGKWELPAKGKVAFKKGEQEIDEDRLLDNPSALDLEFDSGSGRFDGEFNVYQNHGEKIASKGFSVVGVMVNGIGYGMAYSKGVGAFAVTIE